MAIYPTATSAAAASAQPTPIDIEAWTEQAAQALSVVTISAAATTTAAAPTPLIRGTSVTLDIPLDDHHHAHPAHTTGATSSGDKATLAGQAARPGYIRRREPLRRDSLKKREALLKGKEGSRRRQRWENDRLLNNPYAQPPLPSDWEVHPTYPVHSVPYYLAPLWDAERASRSARSNSKSAGATGKAEEAGDEQARVPRELREKLKRARGAKGLLMDLEEEVRRFVLRWEERQQRLQKAGVPVEPDSEDEEIVFVGRNGTMSDMRAEEEEELRLEKLVFDSPADDQGASFGRWLVHSIGTYYGLRTWSVTVGDPARREAYVGIKDNPLKTGRRVAAVTPLPRPLWGMV